MKKIIIANWKMNPSSQKEAQELFDAVKMGAGDAKADVAICPPFVYVSYFMIQDSGLKLGAQNVSLEAKGAFTSQISAGQLKDLGVEYVIVGHSESRKYLRETNEEIAKKVAVVLDAGMVPILCVGENEGEDREVILKEQLSIIQNSKLEIQNLVVAYEPIWAVGTGKNCQPDDVKKAVEAIKSLAGDVKVLYGGSVKADNAQQYLEIADGLLIGGASLSAEEFVKIILLA